MGFFDPIPEKPFEIRPVEYHFENPAVVNLVKRAMAGDLDAIRSAIADGASPNAIGHVQPGSSFGFLPLHYLVATNSERGIQLLKKEGADPALRAPEMGSPLLFAISLNRSPIFAVLLEGNVVASLDAKTRQQLLFESARRNCSQALKLLISQGVPIDIRDDAGYTLMLRSIEMEELELTLWLLENGASVDIRTSNGLTPAYSIQFEKQNSTPPGSTKAALLDNIAHLMMQRGVKFPAPSPEQVRAGVL